MGPTEFRAKRSWSPSPSKSRITAPPPTASNSSSPRLTWTKSIPVSEDLFNLSLKKAREILDSKQSSGRILGKDTNSNKEIELKRGRFGFYITNGSINVSLKNGEDVTITLEEAIEKIKNKMMQSE